MANGAPLEVNEKTRVTVTIGALVAVVGLVVGAATWMSSINAKLGQMEARLQEQSRLQKEIAGKLNERLELVVDLRARVRILERELEALRKKGAK